MRNYEITSSEYLVELTNLYESKRIKNTHEIQLLLAKANYNVIKLNYLGIEAVSNSEIIATDS
jgi:hypothetical protein